MLRLRRVINHDARLIFKRYDGVHMIYRRDWFTPRQTSVCRGFNQHPALRARRPSNANADERKMNVISSAVVAEINGIVTLREIFCISDRYRLPGVAPV